MKIGPKGKFALLLLAAVGLAIILALLQMSHLPWRMPDDFAVQWRSGGGDSPASSQAVISTAESHWTFYANHDQNRQEYTFSTSQQEMAELYGLIRHQSFDTLQEDSGSISEGDYSGISLLWPGHYINIWGLRVIASQQDRYQAIYDSLQDFLEQKVPEHPALK